MSARDCSSRFFTGRYTRGVLNAEPVTIGIEQGNNGKTFDFACPTSLASNLLYFQSLTDFGQAGELKRIPEQTTHCVRFNANGYGAWRPNSARNAHH